MGKSNMIKRADGSYSQRGLWDNIRANKGSGKEPTKEMLKQERKINAKYKEGGTTDKPKFPGKLETNQSDNTRVLNTEGRTVANSKLQDGYNKNEIIQYGTNKGKPYGFENQTIRGGMESLVTPDNVMMATGVGALAKAGVNAVGNKFLPNAYKLNPFAFKPNPENYYHRSPDLKNIVNTETKMLQGFGQSEKGKAVSELAKSSGKDVINLKKPANSQLYFSKGTPLDYGRYNSAKLGMSGQGYAGPYIVEAKGIPMGASVKGRLPKATPPSNLEGYAVSQNPIPANNVKFYKEDWLKGYKEIPNTYPNGGTIDDEAGKRGMMKARMALDAHFGNPSAQRMVSPNPKTGMTPEGIGTHYMVSMDNYAVPLLQDKGGNYLQYNSNPAPSSEDMRFESPEDAKYFAENYKNIAPMMRSNKFAGGGTSGGRVPVEEPVVKSDLSTKIIRNVANTVLPTNAAQLAASLITKDSKYGVEDASYNQQAALFNTLENARKRTGKNKGGTEYIDYGKDFNTDLQNLKGNPLSIVLGSALSDDFNAATTFGRVSYDYDPKSQTYKVFDSYDYSKTPNTNTAYSSFRNAVGKAAEVRSIAANQQKAKYIGNMSKKDYTGTPKNLSDRIANAITPNIPYKNIKQVTGGLEKEIGNLGNDLKTGYKYATNEIKDVANTASKYYNKAVNTANDYFNLKPGNYTETQIQEAIKNKSIPKKSLGGRVLPKFYDGGGVRLTGSSTFNSAMKAPAGTVTKTASGKAPSNFGDNVVTGAGIAGAAVPILTSFIPDDRITDSEGNEVGSKQSLGKGVLNGAAQGASMGAAAGPWGAAIGAGVGAIYGGVTNSMNNADVDRAQQQANMRIQNRNISNSVLTNKNMFSTNVNNNDQMIAANGGTVIDEDMGNPNAELELNETFRDPMTGEVGMVDGPSHDNGGIEMSLAEGTQIWSDRLKHNGRTFASLTKPIINKIATLEKGTKDNPNSRFKQNSIKLLNSQLDFFFDIQESNKQQDEMKRTLKKQEGGVVDDMGNYHYANGGIYIKPENRGKFTAYKERTGKTTEEALHSPDPHVRQMANFAKNAAGWKHAEGGYVLPKFAGAGTFGDPETEPVIPEEVPYVNDFNAKSRRDFLFGMKGDLNKFRNDSKNTFEQGLKTAMYGNSWNKKGYTLGANGAAGDQYTFDKIGKPTYQETEAQPQNNSGFRRNNTGELIQAGALAGSTFAQLNNINRQAAPGIRPDVRLTGAIPNPKYVDLSAERGAINRSALGAMGEAQRGFGNSATAQAFKNKARINQLEGLGKSFSNQEIANADIVNKFAGMRGDAAMKEAMMNNEIANTNLENKYQFNQNRMANQNAAIGTLGHGFGDIGRNRTNQYNEMERLGSISNRYDKSAYASSIRDNPERLKQGIDAGMYTIDELQKWGIPYTPQAKYGGTFKKGTIKNRSLKY